MRPESGNAYPLRVASEHIPLEARVYAPGRERQEGQIGGKIPSACANHRVKK
jgi:hypothetical protein